MSRSYKKSFAYCACCHSQKAWRSQYNRTFRRKENLKANIEEDFSPMKNPFKEGYADLWCGPTDGKAAYLRPEWYEGSRYIKKFCPFKKHGHHLFHK